MWFCNKTYCITVFTLVWQLNPKDKCSASFLFSLKCSFHVSLVHVCLFLLLACSTGLYSISQSSPICFLPVCLLPSLLWLYYYYYCECWKDIGTTEAAAATTAWLSVQCVLSFKRHRWNKPRRSQNIWHLSPCLFSPHPLSPSPLCALVSDGLSLPSITSTY